MRPAARRCSAVAALLLPAVLVLAGESPAPPVPVAPVKPAAPAALPPPPAQAAMPPEAEIERVAKELRTLYKGEYASRKSDERVELARKLLAQGRLPGDATSRFVMLQESCELAAKAGAVDLLVEALDAWGTAFRIDAGSERLRLLPIGGQSAATAEQAAAAALALGALADESVQLDQFAVALKCMAQAEQVARRARDPGLLAQLREQTAQYKEWADAWSQIGDVEDPLGGISATGHARLGRFRALVQGDWGKALPHLAQGDDQAMRDAAVAEQAAKTPEAHAAAADAWYEIAGKERAAAKLRIQSHCAGLYQLALDGLGGLERARIDKRLGELERALGGARGNARRVPGAVLYLSFERDSLGMDSGKPVALDSSGRNLHGRITGGRPETGPFGMAMAFAGAGGSIELGNPRDLAIAGSMSIAMWLQPSVVSLRRNPFYKCYGSEGAITIEPNGSLNYFYGANGVDDDPYQGHNSTQVLAAGVWSHVVLVRDLGPARRLIWYFNGRRASEVAAAYPTSKASPKPVVLANGYTGVPYLGLLDEFAIWPRALNDAEVKLLHEATATGR